MPGIELECCFCGFPQSFLQWTFLCKTVRSVHGQSACGEVLGGTWSPAAATSKLVLPVLGKSQTGLGCCSRKEPPRPAWRSAVRMKLGLCGPAWLPHPESRLGAGGPVGTGLGVGVTGPALHPQFPAVWALPLGLARKFSLCGLRILGHKPVRSSGRCESFLTAPRGR